MQLAFSWIASHVNSQYALSKPRLTTKVDLVLSFTVKSLTPYTLFPKNRSTHRQLSRLHDTSYYTAERSTKACTAPSTVEATCQ